MIDPPPYSTNNIFAKILRGEMPCELVYENEYSFAFMDIMPRADGHVLVLPKFPARTFFDLPQKYMAEFMLSLQKLARGVYSGMKAEGLTLQQFNEAAGGQVVFHLHFHLLPRWRNVPLRSVPAPQEKPEILAAYAARIREVLEALKES